MSLKALHMKVEDNRVYWYFEYYAAIPNSADLGRTFYVYIDADRNALTGSNSYKGADYYVYFSLKGDNSSYSRSLRRWNSTKASWDYMNSSMVKGTLKPGIDYVEFSVETQAINYDQRGFSFYAEAYSYVSGLPGATFTYVLGSNQRTVAVDGEPGDWGDSVPCVSYPSKSLDPAELEVASIYCANDQDNLYVRVDMRGVPTANIDAAALYRWVYLYMNTDENNATGGSNRGSDFYAYAYFQSTPARQTGGSLYRFTGPSQWGFTYVTEITSRVSRVFEFSVPLEKLGLGPSGSIEAYVSSSSWDLFDYVPRPTYKVSFPVAATTGGFSIVGLFGSEALFLAAVLGLMALEAVVIVLLMRRGKKEVPPPPP